VIKPSEFDRFALSFIEKLRNSKQYARRAEKLKRDFLGRPEVRALAGDALKRLSALAR